MHFLFFYFLCSRWLSLHKCVTRLLDNWELLTKFFEDEAKKNKPKKRKATANLDLGPVKKRIIEKKSVPKGKPNTTTTSGGSKPKTSATTPTTSAISAKPTTSTSVTTTISSGSSKSMTSTTSSSTLPALSTSTGSAKPTTGTSSSTTSPGSSKLKITTTSSSTMSVASSTFKTQTNEFDLSGHLFRQEQIGQQYMKLKQQRKSGEQVKTKKPGLVPATTKKKPASTNNQDKEATKGPEPQKHKSELIYEQFKNPNAKLYALFLKTTMPFFEQPNQVGASCVMIHYYISY